MTAPVSHIQPSIVERIRQRINDAPMPIEQLLDDAADRIEALEGALTDTLCELTACARQLAARGLKGHPEDSVSRAQLRARAALSSQETDK